MTPAGAGGAWLLVEGIGELTTAEGSSALAGADQGRVVRHRDVELVARDGEILFIGPAAERRRRWPRLEQHDSLTRLDAGGRAVIPGLVDAHTHLPWAGSRETEFAQRLAGRTYLEIAAAGGGILSTVTATRAASAEELGRRLAGRCRTMLQHGTTTAEAKSGYGLELETELRQLRAVADYGGPLELVPTLMAAHEFPPEYRDDRGGWVEEIAETIVPAAAEAGLARFCDVFCERGVFTVEQARRVLEAGIDAGLVPRLHADEFVDSGGAELAAELGAASADHVAAVSERGLAAMAAARVPAVLLPGVNFFLMKDSWAPARRFIDAGVPVVLATDCNPGSSHTESLPFIVQLAIFHLRMTVEECLVAVTLNAAHVLGLADRIGTLEVGKQADLVVLDRPNLLHLGYHLGVNPVRAVVKGGTVVVPEL